MPKVRKRVGSVGGGCWRDFKKKESRLRSYFYGDSGKTTGTGIAIADNDRSFADASTTTMTTWRPFLAASASCCRAAFENTGQTTGVRAPFAWYPIGACGRFLVAGLPGLRPPKPRNSNRADKLRCSARNHLDRLEISDNRL